MTFRRTDGKPARFATKAKRTAHSQRGRHNGEGIASGMAKRPTLSRNGDVALNGRGGAAIEPDRKRALDLVLELMAIPGPSGQEGRVVEYITDKLRQAGAPASAIRTDTAHRRTVLSGEVGNLVFRLPGNLRGPRRLLMAHIDTVPLCVGSQPVLRGGWVESADPRTGLGADNRAGAAVVLNTALEIIRRRLPHPPLTFYWPVQEEVGLQGVQHARLGLLGKPQLAFNWDGGAAEKLTVGATGAYRLRIEVQGQASHAGGAPEQGISAVAIAGLAIAELQKGGWHGDIRKGRNRGTSNVGVIQGGAATNVVAPLVEVRAEARSHDPEFRQKIVRQIEDVFHRAARSVRNVAGDCGKIEATSRLDYEAYCLPSDAPCVLAAESAIRAVGLEPQRAVSNGGLDANWMTARGIPTVTLGCGQQFAHTTSERLDVAVFETACRIALRLGTAAS